MALQSKLNQTPTNGARAWAILVWTLIQAGGTVRAYANGSGSRVTATATTDWGHATTGIDFGEAILKDLAYAWVIVSFHGEFFIIQRNAGAAGTNTTWYWAVVVGTLNTDGDGTHTDTVASGRRGDIRGTYNATPSSMTFVQCWAADNGAGIGRVNCVADDTTPYKFYVAGFDIGTVAGRSLHGRSPVSCNASDTSPYVYHGRYQTSGVCAYGNMMTCDTNGQSKAWDSTLTWRRAGVPNLSLSQTNGGFNVVAGCSVNGFSAPDDAWQSPWMLETGGSARVFKGVDQMISNSAVGRTNGATVQTSPTAMMYLDGFFFPMIPSTLIDQ